MVQDFFDDLWLFNAGNHFDFASTLRAGCDVDVKHSFEPLGPGHV